MLFASTIIGIIPSQEVYVAPEAPKIAYTESSREEWVKQRIQYFASKYGVPFVVMDNVVRCESQYNPNAINSTPKEYSVGLVQINLKAHTDITEDQAKDPDFALEFLAKHIKDRPSMWSCYRSLFPDGHSTS